MSDSTLCVFMRGVFIKVYCLQGGCLFEVSKYSRLGAYSNKYDINEKTTHNVCRR